MNVKIIPYEKPTPVGKLADAELHFLDGDLAGMKLLGFSIWERRGNAGGRSITFPARQFVVNGGRRAFSLFRPIDDSAAPDRIRDRVLQAYTDFEEGQGTAPPPERPAAEPTEAREEA